MFNHIYRFWLLTDIIVFFASPAAILVSLLFSAAGASLVGTLKHIIQDSALYQWIFLGRYIVNGEYAEPYEHQHVSSTTKWDQEAQ